MQEVKKKVKLSLNGLRRKKKYRFIKELLDFVFAPKQKHTTIEPSGR